MWIERRIAELDRLLAELCDGEDATPSLLSRAVSGLAIAGYAALLAAVALRVCEAAAPVLMLGLGE